MPWQTTHIVAHDVASSVTTIPLDIAGIRIILVAWDDRWYAIEDRCSHAGCSFIDDGEVDGFHAICNCHGSEFDVRSGRPLRSPATAPIRTFSVRIVSGMIEVEL